MPRRYFVFLGVDAGLEEGKYSFTSVGIDIGTSTTKLIVSKLRVARTANMYSLPRYEIIGRTLEYASPIYPTPLLSQQEIDMQAVSGLVNREYERIGLSWKDIRTGAVIITGETANKTNARQVVHSLAEQAGNFVVAIAGADVEGMLAGKGSGAEQRSRCVPGVVANIDIGGGTANAAFFQRGKLIGTITFHLGGRLIRLNAEGRILGISPEIKVWLRDRGFTLAEGDRVSISQLEAVALAMCRDMAMKLTGRFGNASGPLPIVGKHPTAPLPKIEEIMITGGVGALMQTGRGIDSIGKAAEYGDFGPLLADALKRVLKESPFRPIIPDQTSRATVIGSGMQSTELSGATVFISPSVLPLRNLPVVPIEWADEEQPEASRQQAEVTMELVSRFYGLPTTEAEADSDAEGSADIPFAIAVKGPEIHSYVRLQGLAKALVELYDKHVPGTGAIVAVCEHNMAKALGQAIYLGSGRRRKVVCIDQIRVEQGDYIDIGEPLSGDLVPVVVKTLVFAK